MVHETQFISASDFIESNPNPVFSKVIRAGFELWYKIEYVVGERHVDIKVTSSGNCIGKADFVEDDATTDIQNVGVDTAFRRCGVGTAMCVLAAKILGKPLRNIWDASEMTAEGKAFWEHLVSQLNNRFG